MLARLWALTATVSCVLAAGEARAAVIHVATTGSDTNGCGAVDSPCLTIGQGLSEAGGAGDVVQVAAGTYNEALVLRNSGVQGNPFTLRGAGPTTVIDGAGTGNASVMRVQASDAVIEDLAIVSSPGHAIWIEGRDRCTVRRVTVTTPTGSAATCLHIVETQQTLLEDVVLSGCPSVGIDLEQDSGTVVRRADVSGCGDEGVSASGSSGAELRGVRVHDNGASCAGCAGIRVGGASGLLISSDTPGGTPSLVSGHAGPAVEISGSQDGLIEHLVALENGGGVHVASGLSTLVLQIDHVTIAGSAGGAAVADLSTGTALSVQNSVLAFNPEGGLTSDSAIHSNNLRHQNGAGNVALGTGELDADPLFADLAGGDVHLLSQHGRFDPHSGWVTDDQSSPAIDLGDPGAPYVFEPGPNGGRANAGAYGNTAQASMSSTGTPTDAALPDSSPPDVSDPDAALPDTLQPDAALPDAAQLDAAQPDAGAFDASTADSAVPDSGLPDAQPADANQLDVVAPDSGQRDRAASDALGVDALTLDGGLGDIAAGQDGAVGQDSSSDADAGPSDRAAAEVLGAEHDTVVIARAGEDFEILVPNRVVLDGQQSVAPAGAGFTWTLADGPQGPGSAPVGTQPITTVPIEQPGIWVFQLTVSAGEIADSDQVVVTAVAAGEPAVEGCGCASAWPAGPAARVPLALAAISALLARVRRRRFPARS